MTIIMKPPKQPAERQDYDVDFTDWLADNGSDTLSTGTPPVVTAETGITLAATGVSGGIVKVWLSGGTAGHAYKITVTGTTVGGRIRQVEFVVQVQED